MSIERVKAFFAERGMEDGIMEFDVSIATVELAAKAIGCKPERIAKTLSFLLGDHALLVVFAGDARVDNPKFKAVFHTKARMLNAEQLDELVGHAPGGVCPFAVKEGCEIYLDESLKRFETVFPACGSSNSAIELDLHALEEFSGALGWVDVAK